MTRAKTFFVAAILMCVGCGAARPQSPGAVKFTADHVSLSVTDMATEVAWYERVMGFKEVRRANFTPTVEFVELTIPTYRIDLIQNTASVRHRVLAPELEQGWKHIAFLTPAIEADLNTLQAQKTDVAPMRNKDGSYFKITLHDPEGNEIEIQPATGSGAVSADNPLGLAPGHATLTVANLDKEVNWYVRVLGFTPGERTKIGDSAVVCHMSIPGYRIDLSSNKGSVRHVVLKRDLEQGWVHVVFKATDIDAVYQRLIEEKAELTGVDRDKDGKITQVFVDDPEGNEIEFVK